jgi:hypothetical protein
MIRRNWKNPIEFRSGMFARIIGQTVIEGVKQKLDRVAWAGEKVAPIGISTEKLFIDELDAHFKNILTLQPE